MNEAEVRNLFDTAASGPVDVDRVDPMAILRAGRRSVTRRRRIGAAVAGGVAAVLAVGAAVGFPMAFGGDSDRPLAGAVVPGGLPTAPVDDALLGRALRADRADCPLPEGQTGEQQRAAAVYSAAFFAALTDFGAEPAGVCLTTRPDYDGFYYSADQGLYRTEEVVTFGGDDWAQVTGAVWDPAGVDYQEQMESEECSYGNVDCSWEDRPEGRVLRIEGSRDDFLDPDTEAEGSAEFPVVAAFLFREDGMIVSMEIVPHFASDRPIPDIDQLVGLLAAFPVDEEAAAGTAPGTLAEAPASATGAELPSALAEALASAAGAELPGATVDTGSAELVRLAADTPLYGSEGTHVLFALAELPSGETVRLSLQIERMPADATEEAVAARAGCDGGACETESDGTGVSVHRTVEGDRPGLTAFGYRPGGLLIGLGAESLTGEAPQVDFATLDAVLDRVA
jgi:hypothetical protein